MNSLSQCRICLAERSDLESIYAKNKNIMVDIFLLTGIKIIEMKDKANALICKRCLADLLVASDFRKKCIHSDRLLQKSLQYAEKDFWEQQEIPDKNALEIKLEHELRQEIKVEPEIDFLSEEEDEDYTWKYDDDYDYAPNIREKSYVQDIVLDDETLKSLICPYCHKKLNTRRSLKYHIQVKHEAETSGRYECDFCGKAFPNKHPLKRHINQAHMKVSSKYVKKNETDIACMLCKVVLKNRKSYRNHVKNKHNKWLDIIFPKLDKKNNNNNNKGQAESRQTAQQTVTEEPQCPCAICGKIFKNKRNLSQHEKTHRVLQPHEYFYCDLCGNKFKEKILMQIHIRKRHIQKIRYQCELCTCSYTTNHSLQVHIKVRHKNIRDWICNWCGKDFGEKKKLVAHERIHTGEQPFHCHICDAKFTHQTDYRRHKWNHEGRKSFKCQMCGEGYVKRSELISHKNRCHAWKAYQQQQQQYNMNMFPSNLPPNMNMH